MTDPDAQRRQQKAASDAVKWSRRASKLSSIEMWLVIGPIAIGLLLACAFGIWLVA